MRLKHDVWSEEISFSRSQRAEKRMGLRWEGLAAGGTKNLGRTARLSFFTTNIHILKDFLPNFCNVLCSNSKQNSKTWVCVKSQHFSKQTNLTFCVVSALAKIWPEGWQDSRHTPRLLLSPASTGLTSPHNTPYSSGYCVFSLTLCCALAGETRCLREPPLLSLFPQVPLNSKTNAVLGVLSKYCTVNPC